MDETQNPLGSERAGWTPAKVSDLYFLRTADLDDDEEIILQLWKHISRDSPPELRKLNWFYRENPAGLGLIYLLVYKPTDRAVGIVCIGRREFRIGNRVLRGGVFGDFAIDPMHRSLGPALFFQQCFLKCALSDLDIVYGFPNARSERIRNFGGYRLDGALDTYVLPIRSTYFLKRYVPSWLAEPAGALLGLWIRLRIWIGTRSKKRKFKAQRVNQAFFDKLWSVLDVEKRRHGLRDWSFIAWRFKDCPYVDYEFFGIRELDDTPAAYLVYRRQGGEFVEIVDFLAVRDDALRAMLSSFLACQFQQDTASVTISIPTDDKIAAKSARALGFSFRGKNKFFIGIGKHVDGCLDENSFFISMADNDV